MTETDYRHRCTTAGCPYLGQLTDNLSCGCHRKESEIMRAELARLTTPRPIDEYHEDMGSVLWWRFPIEEPPYVGSPNVVGYTVEARVELANSAGRRVKSHPTQMTVGGWPDYHTHFTPIPLPVKP